MGTEESAPVGQMRCATCKHWDRLDADGLGIGNCLMAQNEDGWNAPHGRQTLAFATGENPSGRWANLRAEPTFGCVQWQPSDGVASRDGYSLNIAAMKEVIEGAILAFEQMDLTFGGYQLLADMREAIGIPRNG